MYSIESTHLLPYVLYTHLLASEFLVCTLKRAAVSLQHVINVAFLTIIFSHTPVYSNNTEEKRNLAEHLLIYVPMRQLCNPEFMGNSYACPCQLFFPNSGACTVFVIVYWSFSTLGLCGCILDQKLYSQYGSLTVCCILKKDAIKIVIHNYTIVHVAPFQTV